MQNTFVKVYNTSLLNRSLKKVKEIFKAAAITCFAKEVIRRSGNFMRHSVSFQSISLPYYALQKAADKEYLKKYLKGSFFESTLSKPFLLPLSFYGGILSGYLLGRGLVYGFLVLPLILADKSTFEIYKNSFLSRVLSKIIEIEIDQTEVILSKKYLLVGFLMAFIVGFLAGDTGVFIILSIFILANPQTGIYLSTALCLFAPAQNICILALVTVYSYIGKTALYKGMGKAPGGIDLFIYIFTLLIIFVWGTFNVEIALITASFLLYYMAFTGLVKNRRLWRNSGIVFIVSAGFSALLSILGYGGDFSESLRGNTKAFGEFYMLTIPFAFAFVTDTKKTAGTVCLVSGLIMCIALLVNLSKGVVTGSVLALTVFLCIRDIRFIWPSAIALATFSALFFGSNDLNRIIEKSREFQIGFSVFSNIRGEFFAFSLMAVLVLGVAFFVQTRGVKRKGSLIRSMTAAASSGGFGMLAQGVGGVGDEYRLVFVFWTFLSLLSAGIQTEKNKKI